MEKQKRNKDKCQQHSLHLKSKCQESEDWEGELDWSFVFVQVTKTLFVKALGGNETGAGGAGDTAGAAGTCMETCERTGLVGPWVSWVQKKEMGGGNGSNVQYYLGEQVCGPEAVGGE